MSDSNTPVLTDKEQRSRLNKTIGKAYMAGLAVLPPKSDGSKSPYPRTWKEFQTSRPTKEKLNEWYSNKLTGIGYVCGSVSGNVECLDFDEREIYPLFREEAEKALLLDVLERIEQGYMEYSPKGVHLLYRCPEIGGSDKLATRPKRPEEMKHAKDTTKTLIETRGEGGYVIAAPTYGNVHPDGEYTLVSGDITTIVEITPEEREDLLALARTFHVRSEEKVAAESTRVARDAKAAGRPGDDFNNRTEWLDVLAGWSIACEKDGITYLRKPGKATGVHGTINADATDRFYCFTTATDFDQKYYDKFSVYAVLNHGGDFRAAAKDLAAKGYGNSNSTNPNVTSITDVTWDHPMMFGELKTPEIPPAVFPGVYGNYVDAVSKATQTPSGMAAMFMLSIMATCLQGKAVVAPKPGGYHEPLMLWTVSAMPPASRKTAVMQHLMAPVTFWEAEKAAEIQDSMAEAKTQRDIADRRIEKLKQKAGKAESDEELAEYMSQIKELTEQIPDEVVAPRAYSGDVNSEGLQKLLVENNGRMSVLTDEGGVFEVMGGMYSNGKVNINVFLQGHAGSPVRVDRAGRSVTINDPCLTFGLVIQPDVVAKLSSNSKSSFRGNGCLARFLFCIPEPNIGKRDIRQQVDIAPSLKAEYITSIKALLDLPAPNQDDTNVPTITLDYEALNLWQDFAQWVEGELGPTGSMESIQDWGGKLAGAALRIAGLFHIVEFGIGSKQISATAMKNAIKLAELLIEHARAAFDMMGADKETEDAKYLLKRIVNNREECFNRNQLHKQVHGKFPKVDKLIAALAVLTERGIISEPVNKATGRRPEILHYVNPKVWEMA